MKVAWEAMTLPTKAEPGYGERVLPAGELAKQVADANDPRPILVWFYGTGVQDKFYNSLLDTQVFVDEPVAVTLQKFRCIKIDVASIGDEAVRKTYEKTPAFHLFDPKAELVGKLEGDLATSLPRFSSLVRKGWSKVYTVSQSTFVRKMIRILDGYDRLTAKRSTVSSGSEARTRTLEVEEAKLRQAEKDLHEALKVKKAYL